MDLDGRDSIKETRPMSAMESEKMRLLPARVE